jgi:hypothetical protein
MGLKILSPEYISPGIKYCALGIWLMAKFGLINRQVFYMYLINRKTTEYKNQLNNQ